MSDGLSTATLIWRLGMMCIFIEERFAVCAQVEGTQGEIFTMSLIALQSRCMCVPNEPILMSGYSWPQRQSARSNPETDRARRNGATAIRGQYAMRRVVLRPGAVKSAPVVFPTALTEHVHSDGAILSGRKYFC